MNKLREPLDLGESVFILAERLRKTHKLNLIKVQQKIIPFLIKTKFALLEINLYKMELLCIYFNEVWFHNEKNIYVLRYGQKDEIQKVLFSSDRDYFLSSMKSFPLDDGITDWKYYKKIKCYLKHVA